jgi:general secretion pathway protein J
MRRIPGPGAPGGPFAAALGFTLVEVLVALVVMAVLAGLAWRGLDGIVRSREISNEALDRSLRLNTVVTQWEQDLLAVQDTGAVPPLAFDGQTLRLTRRVDGGVALVVWAVRGGRWQRWTTPPVTRVSALSEQWLRSQQLLGNEPAQINLAEAVDWQVYYFRGNAWTNAQSTGDFAPGGRAVPTGQPPGDQPRVPDGTQDQEQNQGQEPNQVQQQNLEQNQNPQRQDGNNRNGGTPPPQYADRSGRELLPDAVRLVITLKDGVLTRDIALGPGG